MSDSIHCDHTFQYPLTHPQKRIWYVENIYPHSPLHNIGGPVTIKGSINFKKLEEAIRLFIQRHDGIRLTLTEESGEIKQYVSEAELPPLDFIDFTGEDDPLGAFDMWVQSEASRTFDLLDGRLFYFALFSTSEQENGFFVKLHHMISDGWSTSMLTDQIWDNYVKLLNNEHVVIEPSPSYTEYIELEHKYLVSRRLEQDRVFWMNKYKTLPESYERKRFHGNEGMRRTFELPADLSSSLKSWAADYPYSLNTFFVALYFLYVNKTTDQNDAVIGTPVFNRSGARQKSIFGMFTSTMPFRFTVEPRHTFLEMLGAVHTEMNLCYKHHKYPYNLLVQDLHGNGDGQKPLFDVCVNYYNSRHNTRLNGMPITNTEFYTGQQLYALQWIIRDWSETGNLLLDIDYQVEEYTRDQIEQMYKHLIQLLRLVISSPGMSIQDMSLLTREEETWQLHEFNRTYMDYPALRTINQLFEVQVEKTPNRIAVSFGEKGLTYCGLNEKANSLAQLLSHRGLGKESVIGIYMDHSMETIISIIAIFKAGGAYLPLDPSSPPERMEFMLNDAGVRLLLTNRRDVPHFQGEVLHVDDINLMDQGEKVGPEVSGHPADLAYLIYTSGSTGRPKGTRIGQQALVNYISWACKMYVSEDIEVFPLYSSLAFDLTVTSIFTPLLSGGQITVYRDDGDEHVLYRILKENKATVLKLTPSHLTLFKDKDYRQSSIRRFIVGGEDLKTELAASIQTAWGWNVDILNEYGPTETTVGCMIHRYDPQKDTGLSVPIGRPADNVQIYVLDSRRRLVPTGSTGEIYISGDGLAKGYLNRPDITQASFLPHPFIPGATIYKTGDLGRFRSDGVLEYRNRADAQLSIRGYRIEPGEIESCMLAHKAIREAVVISFQQQLCAYVVKRSEVSDAELRSHLAATLPHYMIPLYFIAVEKIPLTNNGKVNPALLPDPPIDGALSDSREENLSLNGQEAALAKSLQEVLKVEQVRKNHNFYQLGGDSIKAIQIVSAMKAMGYKITANDILTHPVIGDMALYVQCNHHLVVENQICEGSIKKTPITAWFFTRQLTEPQHYHQSVMLELTKPISIEMLETVLNELIRQHDTLRINVDLENQGLFYNSRHVYPLLRVQEYDLSSLTYEQQQSEMQRIKHEIREGMDLSTDLLIQACVFRVSKQLRLLFVTAHHLVVDGVSWRILMDDMKTIALQMEAGSGIELGSSTLSYQLWAEKLKSYGQRIDDHEVRYWEDMLRSSFRLDDPSANEAAVLQDGRQHSLAVQLTQEETQHLLTVANDAFSTRPLELMLTALLLAINEYTGRREIILDLEGHGRESLEEELDVSRTVGWFTSLYPFSIQLAPAADLSEPIKQVKEKLRGVPRNGMGFGILKYLTGPLKDEGERQLIFNYLGEFNVASDDSDWFKLVHDSAAIGASQSHPAIYGMEVNSAVLHQRMILSLTYSANRFKDIEMEHFIASFQDHLSGIIQYCLQREQSEYTPSDFDGADLTQAELDSLFS